jgi:hypothetical protein
MRTLSTATLTVVGQPVTSPGFLVRLGFDTPLHLSTMADVTWNGQLWVAAPVDVEDLAYDGSGTGSGSLILGNTDNVFGALVLNEGAAGIAVQIYAAYAGLDDLADVELVFDGETNGADIDATAVCQQLLSESVATASSPRVFINAAAGFNHLQPAGTQVFWGTETFTLERN